MLTQLRQIRLPLVGGVVLVIFAAVAFLVIEAARGSVEASELPPIEIGQVAPGVTDTSLAPGPQGPGAGTTTSGSTGGPSIGSTSTATTVPGTGGQTTTTGSGSSSQHPGASGGTVRETVHGSVRGGTTTSTTQGGWR